jgi:hypothetical protein
MVLSAARASVLRWCATLIFSRMIRLDPPVSCIRKPLVTNGRRTSTPSAAGSLWNRLTTWDSTCDACAHVPSIPSTPSTPYGCVPRGWCALACPKVSLVAVACTLPQAPVLVYCGWYGARGVRERTPHSNMSVCVSCFHKNCVESCQKILASVNKVRLSKSADARRLSCFEQSRPARSDLLLNKLRTRVPSSQNIRHL